LSRHLYKIFSRSLHFPISLCLRTRKIARTRAKSDRASALRDVANRCHLRVRGLCFMHTVSMHGAFCEMQPGTRVHACVINRIRIHAHSAGTRLVAL